MKSVKSAVGSPNPSTYNVNFDLTVTVACDVQSCPDPNTVTDNAIGKMEDLTDSIRDGSFDVLLASNIQSSIVGSSISNPSFFNMLRDDVAEPGPFVEKVDFKVNDDEKKKGGDNPLLTNTQLMILLIVVLGGSLCAACAASFCFCCVLRKRDQDDRSMRNQVGWVSRADLYESGNGAIPVAYATELVALDDDKVVVRKGVRII